MVMLAEKLKILSEPACAASLVGAIGPLADETKSRNLGLIACGSNISVERWQSLVSKEQT